MEFEEVVRSRRSVRKFAARAVSDEVVRSLIACAVHAPSSMNGQPWRFVVIRDAKLKAELAEMKNRYCPVEKIDFSADFLKEAPILIVTCVERSRSFDRGLENGVLATGHLLLAAASHGLTGVYLSAYQAAVPQVAQDVRDILDIPAGFDPITIIAVGYPGLAPPAKSIKAVGEVAFRDRFGRGWD